jgi:hypothetical protein
VADSRTALEFKHLRIPRDAAPVDSQQQERLSCEASLDDFAQRLYESTPLSSSGRGARKQLLQDFPGTA